MSGFTFRGIHSSDNKIKVKKVNYSALPDIKVKKITAPNMTGEYDAGVNLGSRVIEVDFILLSTSYAQRKSDIKMMASWLFDEIPKELIFDDQTTHKYMARVENSIDVDEVATYGEGTISFYCASPFGIETTKSSHTMTGGTSIKIDNQGTFKTYPYIILDVTTTTALSQIEIDRDINGDSSQREKVILNGSFVSPDQIIIDCEKGKITHNGTNAITKMTLTSDFFALVKGSQTIHLTSGVSATIDYYKKYL